MFKNARFIMLLIILMLIVAIVSYLLFLKFMPSSNGWIKPKDESIGSVLNGSNNVKYFYNKPIRKPLIVRIKIIKSKRAFELFGNGGLIGRFKIGLGYESSGDKAKEGDGKTPDGKFYICTRIKSQYKYFMGISYPNKEDSKRGLEEGLISQAEYEKINTSIDAKQKPLWDTQLGGAIGLHGTDDSSDWTAGCIALSEEGIDAVWSYAEVGTPVEIVE